MIAPPTPRRPRLRGFHINRMIPNVLTLMALALGLSALRFALDDKWNLAVLAIVGAAILDGLDGRIARILKGASRFGAELDSLSDFLCFGVAPAIVLYVWTLIDVNRVGWSLVLVYCIACALRLARFNADMDADDPPAWGRRFFVGVPSPAAAGLVLLPMILWFQTGAAVFRSPWLVGVVMVAVAGLMVSRLRTFSFKKAHVAPAAVLPTMLGIGLGLALLVSLPWIGLTLAALAYLASIPFSVRAYRRLAGQTAPTETAD